MRISPRYKSSAHCSVSPDGGLVATLSSSIVTVRSTHDLQTVNTIRLPADVIGPVSTFLWSPSSHKLLISATEQIVLLSACDSSFHASIKNPLAAAGRSPIVQFGATDTEVVVCSVFGLKLAVFDLSLAKAVEINSPKFHHPGTFARGYGIRSTGGHLALLTRVGGKDTISIHHPVTRLVQRSWHPELLDAHGMLWTPDGAWLMLWESPAHGFRILLYTPDGQLFRSIDASSLSSKGDAELEPGIRLCQLSPDATVCAVSNYSRTLILLSSKTWRESMRLVHPTTIIPKDTVQIWQEQLGPSTSTSRNRVFQRATQMVSPIGALSEPKSTQDLRLGSSMVAFDASSTLLATRLDDSPSTIWVWDVAAGELRAVLLFHSTVNFQWHPSARELLLVRCLDDAHRGVSYIWDPLMNGPTLISLEEHLANTKLEGRGQVTWVNGQFESPMLFLSDAAHYVLLNAAGDDHAPVAWQQVGRDESGGPCGGRSDEPDMFAAVGDDTSVLDDTFAFKKT